MKLFLMYILYILKIIKFYLYIKFVYKKIRLKKKIIKNNNFNESKHYLLIL
jgi:hypothetical protein